MRDVVSYQVWRVLAISQMPWEEQKTSTHGVFSFFLRDTSGDAAYCQCGSSRKLLIPRAHPVGFLRPYLCDLTPLPHPARVASVLLPLRPPSLPLQPNVTKDSNVGEIGCGGGRVTVEVRTTAVGCLSCCALLCSLLRLDDEAAACFVL